MANTIVELINLTPTMPDGDRNRILQPPYTVRSASHKKREQDRRNSDDATDPDAAALDASLADDADSAAPDTLSEALDTPEGRIASRSSHPVSVAFPLPTGARRRFPGEIPN